MRVLIADDHRLFGQVLEAVLTADGRIQVVGYAQDGDEAVQLTRDLDPDVTVMDVSMPVLDGVEATREIRRLKPGACVLMLSGSDSGADVDRARQAGAVGYLTKDRIGSELIDSILAVACG